MELDYWRAGAVVLGLAVFGWGYDRWVESLEMRGLHRGFVSFLVAIGVGVTGAGYAVVVGSLMHGLVLAVCFVASGAPMMIGSAARYVRKRAAEEEETRRLVGERLGDG